MIWAINRIHLAHRSISAAIHLTFKEKYIYSFLPLAPPAPPPPLVLILIMPTRACVCMLCMLWVFCFCSDLAKQLVWSRRVARLCVLRSERGSVRWGPGLYPLLGRRGLTFSQMRGEASSPSGTVVTPQHGVGRTLKFPDLLHRLFNVPPLGEMLVSHDSMDQWKLIKKCNGSKGLHTQHITQRRETQTISLKVHSVFKLVLLVC